MRYQQITDRDIAVVVSVYKYRYLTGEQIQTLYFPSETIRNRRLQRLIRHGYIKPFEILNIPVRLFRLTKKGADLVAYTLEVPLEDLLWKPNTKDPKDYYFMRHFVATNDFRITLTRACESRDDLDLRGFIPEHYGAKHLSGKVTKYIKDLAFDIYDPREQISHTPDAVFCLGKDDRSALFFLEIDRGTEALSNRDKGVLKMIRFYLGYAKDRTFAGYAEDFKTDPFKTFRVLIVTTSRKRLQNMRSASSALPPDTHQKLRFFWGTTFNNINPSSIFSPIWQSMNSQDEKIYTLG